MEKGYDAADGRRVATARKSDRLHRGVDFGMSLVAAFIPLLFMGGVVGRLFREFSVTLCFRHHAVSTVAVAVGDADDLHAISCKEAAEHPNATWLDRLRRGRADAA